MSNLPKRGWGSLLSGAVAGIESSLDIILADDAEASARSRAVDKEKREKALKEQENSRPSSRNNRVNDRLQARLAQAVGKDGAKSRTSSQAPSPRPESPAVRASVDEQRPEKRSGEEERLPTEGANVETDGNKVEVEKNESTRPSIDSSRKSLEHTQPPEPDQTVRTDNPDPTIAQQVDPHAAEIHEYQEKIDALHSKIAYLTTELHTNATSAAASAESGSLEKKAAEQQAQIAQLIKEGEKLSHDQLKASNAIKSLRVRIQEQDRVSSELRKKVEKSEQESSDLRDRLARAEGREKKANERLNDLSKVEKNLALVMSEKDDALKHVQELTKQLKEAERRADDAEKNVKSGTAEEHVRTIADLKDDLSNSRIEKKLLEDRLKSEMTEIKEAHNRQLEKSKLSEMELRTEVQSLEAKLEFIRLKSEEASASTTFDAQAKLLRQVETLQTQHALASENWQGIENSLNTRIAAIEKERDEVTKRESDVRRKARETNSKARRLEEELDSAQDKISTLEVELGDLKADMKKLESKLNSAEKSLEVAKAEDERNKRDFETTLQSRIEEERTKIRSEFSSQFSPLTPTDANHGFLRTDSFPHRKSSADMVGSQRRSAAGGRLHTDLSSLFPPHSTESPVHPSSRRSNFTRPGPIRSPTDPSLASGAELSPPLPSLVSQMNGGAGTPPTTYMSNAPSIHTVDVEEQYDDFPVRESPQRTVADLISVSTAGAGPSVQLVERMSATVRRLEMEKAASREEITRLQGQRDEARDEVVSLVREIETFKGDRERVTKLETEMAEQKQRYEAALEMLGEKSEECEELKNDVIDLKNIYRELVETMR